MSRTAFGLIAILAIASPVLANAASFTAKPSPGTRAATNEETACDTATHYRDWRDHDGTTGCGRLAEGTAVIIEGVDSDPSDRIPGSTMAQPLVKVRLKDKQTFYLSLMAIHPAGHPDDGFAGSVVDVPKPIDHVQSHPYTLDKMERGFTDRGFCKLAYGGKDFMTLTDSVFHGSYYDFPAGSSVLVIEDNDTGFVVISDDSGHRGCVATMSVPGYLIP